MIRRKFEGVTEKNNQEAIDVPDLGHSAHSQKIKTTKALEAPAVVTELLDVGSVATFLSCSRSSVWRFADDGTIPAPVHIGRLVRWPKLSLTEWINNGCPIVRATGTKR